MLAMTGAARICLLCKPTARHCEAAMPPWQSSFFKGIALTPDYFHLFITLPRVDPPTMTVQDIYYVIAANQHLTGLLHCARNDISGRNRHELAYYANLPRVIARRHGRRGNPVFPKQSH
ncbi:hypothetical protein [Nitrosomonas nitrosa]|uniref:hypothetical protein n=1 Tax=Nitrosomonas nitrosa TaxID=52442 RepID=UPI000D316F7A|nr:hypothetical protein [Nitrosomonas nitrosa]